MHDAIVVGGGPGGLHTATLLAREGFDVTVLEEHSGIGEPVHCTGVFAAEAFDEFDLPHDAILNRLATARFHAPSGAAISHTTPTTEALVVDRIVFDRGLQERARQAGAAVVMGARVSAIETSGQGVIVRCEDGRVFDGRVLVLACGANYKFQRSLGLGMPGTFLLSAQMELPAARSGDVEVYFGRDVAPQGFAWVVPVQRGHESHVRVGLMCDHDAASYFTRFLEQIAPSWGVAPSGRASDAARPRQKMLPLAPVERTYGDRVLAVGDAAGLVKATTGGGIYYSLVSAAAAATVLVDALRKDALTARTLKRYEKIWKAQLGAELDAQLDLRVLAQRLEDDEIDGLFELARTNGVMPIIRKTARFNHHRELIASLFKHQPARRLLFKGLVARTAAASLQ